jgi:hypothetical protein
MVAKKSKKSMKKAAWRRLPSFQSRPITSRRCPANPQARQWTTCRPLWPHWLQTTRRWKLHWQQARRQEQAREREPVRLQAPEPEQARALLSCHKRPTLQLQSGSPIRAISSFQISFCRGQREKKHFSKMPCRRMAALTEQPRAGAPAAQPEIIGR